MFDTAVKKLGAALGLLGVIQGSGSRVGARESFTTLMASSIRCVSD